MKNPDSFFEIPREGDSGMVDVRENFQRLNRLFQNGDFMYKQGRFTTTCTNIRSAAAAPFNVTLDFVRLGPFVMLEVADQFFETTKVNGSTPQLGGSLPPYLRPRAPEVFLLGFTVNNAATVGSIMVYRITRAGIVQFDVYNESWSTGDDVRLYPGPLCYLGQ